MLKQSMMSLATLTLLVSLSGVARAEGDVNEAADGYRPLTCAERTDGDTPHEVPTPQECSRDYVAAANSAEESK